MALWMTLLRSTSGGQTQYMYLCCGAVDNKHVSDAVGLEMTDVELSSLYTRVTTQ